MHANPPEPCATRRSRSRETSWTLRRCGQFTNSHEFAYAKFDKALLIRPPLLLPWSDHVINSRLPKKSIKFIENDLARFSLPAEAKGTVRWLWQLSTAVRTTA